MERGLYAPPVAPLKRAWYQGALFGRGRAHAERGARTPAVMAIEARFDDITGEMELTHPALPPLRFRPETEGQRLIDWLVPISPDERFRPVALVRAPGARCGARGGVQAEDAAGEAPARARAQARARQCHRP